VDELAEEGGEANEKGVDEDDAPLPALDPFPAVFDGLIFMFDGRCCRE